MRNRAAANASDYRASAISTGIAQQAFGKRFGEWSGDISTAASGDVHAAQRAGKAPLLIAYTIPGRDCGFCSAGSFVPDLADRRINGNCAVRSCASP